MSKRAMPAAFRRLCVETWLTPYRYRQRQPAAFRRLCVETARLHRVGVRLYPAAFRRLCVETFFSDVALTLPAQPPSGGCVLKQRRYGYNWRNWYQPPSGGCVLKQKLDGHIMLPLCQPPSGGCVLKRLPASYHDLLFASRLQAAVC